MGDVDRRRWIPPFGVHPIAHPLVAKGRAAIGLLLTCKSDEPGQTRSTRSAWSDEKKDEAGREERRKFILPGRLAHLRPHRRP